MNLYLMRHGEAEPGLIDQLRPLTAHGRQQVQKQAAYLAEQQTSIAHIYHSGYLRAAQTAEIMARYVSHQTLSQLNGLRPLDSLAMVLAELDEWTESTLLVGHLPYLGDLLVALCREYVAFQTATLVQLQASAGVWRLMNIHPIDDGYA